MCKARTITRFPEGTITPPPSKSDTHRALICALLAAVRGGTSTLWNVGASRDIDATLRGIRVLGAVAEERDGALSIAPGEPLDEVIDCGESGSTLRFLIPVAAALRERTVFRGHGRLLERPLEIYERIFSPLGFSFIRQNDTLTVTGRLTGGSYALPGDSSSQFVSGLLLALPNVGGGEVALTTPLQSRQYVDMTIAAMRAFGVVVEAGEGRYRVPAGSCYRPVRYDIETDYSQAAFFLAAAALGREVRIAGLHPDSLQGDRAILDVLRDMGAEITAEDDHSIAVRAKTLRAVKIDAREIPDLVPPIAALCCFCAGESHITGAARLRIKESDRLAALATELGRLGADIAEGPDCLTIRGKPMLQGGTADAWNDHRIAMAAAVAAIRCESPVTLTGWQSVEKSYPRFWADFEHTGKGATP